jgi:HD-like signal output (HDOD) protein
MAHSSIIPLEQEEMEALRSFIADQLGQGNLELPLLPVVANQVLLLSSDPDTESSQLSSLIQQDQALAGQIIRIANSPAYAPRTPIVSLQQAITWLGLNMLAGLAFSVSVQSGVFHTTGYEQEVRTLWRHALATGLFGKEIARRIRHNVENAFLCGLLHTIGKPAILHLLSQSPDRSAEPFSWTTVESLFEEFHVTAGSKLAAAWHLPDPVQETIRFYQDDQYHQATSPTKGAMITCLAQHLASVMFGNSSHDENSLLTLPVVQDLNFYPEDITALLELRETIKPSVECFLP